MNEEYEPAASVVVATYARPRAVIDTIHSLIRQQGLSDKFFEIIIVDNNADKTTFDRVSEYLSEHKEEISQFNTIVRLVQERRRGLSFARNTGIRAARAPIIAFTDDDIIVENYWLSAILDTFQESEVQGVFGFTRSATDDYLLCTKTDSKVCDYRNTSSLWEMGHGNNMAFRRAALLEAGLFDETLGAGSRYKAAEDTDLFYRMLKRRFLLRYQPAARATHYGHLHDEDPVKKLQQYDIGAAAFAAKYLVKGDAEPLKLALKRLQPRWDIIRPYLPFAVVSLIKDQRHTLLGFEQQLLAFAKRFISDYRKNGGE
ncbi:MAG: hypothetical protein Kow0090_12590 [Myxococcota bacterium]